MSNSRLPGQVAVVTGGSSGIGRATVRALAAEGACVAVVDRDADGATLAATEAQQAGVDARPFVVDLERKEPIEPLVQAVLSGFGRIDILVNCAGITGFPHNILDFTDETYETVMNVNLRAPFMLTRAVANHMVERGEGGRIVNISSSAAFRATASPAIYAATKAGINGLTRASAADLGPHGINVNAVAPGLTKTAITAGIGDDEAFRRAVSSGPLANLLGRPSEPEDVANAVVFLCLPESRQITGQVINTSGTGVVSAEALDPQLTGAERVREVFARVRNGDSGVADLYAEDGVVLVRGERIAGREAIRAFYASTIESRHPQPQVQVVLETPGSSFYAAVVEVPSDIGHVHALDLFTLGDGGIRQLEIFGRHID